MSKILLLAKHHLRDRNPAAIPEGVPLEDWLDEYFDFVGPSESEEALKEAIQKIEPFIDPEGNARRYWAIFDLKESVAVRAPHGAPVDPPALS